MVQLNTLSVADRDSMQGMHVHVAVTKGHTHHHAQRRKHTGQPGSDAPLAHDLSWHIHRSFMPFLTWWALARRKPRVLRSSGEAMVV
jgi:hypothetical protein